MTDFLSAFEQLGASGVGVQELGLGALALLLVREAVAFIKWFAGRKDCEGFEKDLVSLLQKMDRRLEFLESKTDKILEQGEHMTRLHADQGSLCSWADAARRAELVRQLKQELSP